MDPRDILDELELHVEVPRANDPDADPLEDLLDRPLRGEVIADDDLYRKSGLHIASWKDTGMCVLYGLQQACTHRPHDGLVEKPRFEIDELMTIFDEVWEEERGLGPRQELVDHFMPFAAKLAKKDADARFLQHHGKLDDAKKQSLEVSIATDRPKGLRVLATRYYGSRSMEGRPRGSAGS